jgi:amino acid transporter
MSLAETGYAPSVFAYVDKSGRPLWALVFVLLFGATRVHQPHGERAVVFNWLLALSGLSTLLTWGTICLCHIRFRKGMAGPGPLGRGAPLPRHVRRLGLLGGLDPRHLGAHRTVLYRDLACERHVVQSRRGRD